MGVFDFLKKNAEKNKPNNPRINITFSETVNGETRTVIPQNTKSVSQTDFEHLTEDGELPFGWVTRNKDFVSQIEKGYAYFWNMWVVARDKSPRELYSALLSFVSYLEDVKNLCESKGECFEFWFREVLTGAGYYEARKKELEELTANIETLEADYYYRNDLLYNLDNNIIKTLIDNPGILQSDFVKMFDPLVQNEVREKLYFMEKAGKLERLKSGRSYILRYKQSSIKGG